MMRYYLSAILLLTTIAALAQYSPAPSTWSRGNVNGVTKELILKDLDIYASTIAQKHIQPFTHIRKGRFFDEIQRVKDSSARYDADQLLVQWMQVNALLQDEHTEILYVSRDVFPFAAAWFEEGVYLTGADTSYSGLIYARVMAVNDRAIGEVIGRMNTLSTNKNIGQYQATLARFLFDPIIIHGLGIAPSRTKVTYTVVTQKNDTVKLADLQARDKRSLRLRYLCGNLHTYWKNDTTDHNYWFSYNDSTKCLYFDYTSCYDEDKQHLFTDMERAMMDTIDAKRPEQIVIDLRMNGGGYPRLMDPFIEHISRSYLNKKGRIYVLIGRHTFSAAVINATTLKQRTYATLIGESTSGSTGFYSAVQMFSLPNTKLQVQYSTEYWQTQEKNDGALVPDVVVPLRFSDVSRDIDAQFYHALTYGSKKKH